MEKKIQKILVVAISRLCSFFTHLFSRHETVCFVLYFLNCILPLFANFFLYSLAVKTLKIS